MPKRKSTDEQIVHDQQHTGNHDYPGQEQGGSDKFGGTRAGAENVEHDKAKAGARPDKQPRKE